VKTRCRPASLILSIAIGTFLICTVGAQAAGGPQPPASAASNAVNAAVRSVQPAVSGLFQVHSPRVWVDALDEKGAPSSNGVPDFLETWQAFNAREDAAILKNGYAFRTIDGAGDEILYAGFLRASSAGPSKVAFEFSQKPGAQLLGDLLVEAEIDGAGNVGMVRFQTYSEGKAIGGSILAILSGEGCSDAGTACIVSNGALLEIGVNLTQLLNGTDHRFKGIEFRAPGDSVVGTFSLTGDAGGCVAEESGFAKAGCTANDIQLTAIVPGSLNTKFCSNDATKACTIDANCTAGGTCVSSNTCSIDGDGNLTGTVTFSATGRFVLTTQTRYDVGLFIDTAGDPEPAIDNKGTADSARSGQCTKFAFSNTEGVNAEGVGDADGCGDLTQAIASAPNGRAMPFGPVTIQCVDKDDDGLVDVYHCETWSQNEDEIDCQSSASVKAGTTSKCNCGLLAGACIPTPNDDACKENVCVLRCSNNSATVCTIGGNECAAPGFCQDTLIEQNKANGSACGDQTSGDCKLPDTCQAGVCTTGLKSSTTQCRAANGQCDVAESCTGTSATCPTDGFQPATTACTGTSNGGVCDGTDSCAGTTNTCVDGFQSSTTSCRAANGQCDVGESCTGSSGACPGNGFQPATTPCVGTSNGGDCDGTDSCAGTTNTCVDGFLTATTICRAQNGVCDLEESCSGTDGSCPTDAVVPGPGTTECRASDGSLCDPAEFCDGVNKDCPGDICLGGTAHP
jgi:hypothetical protein